MLAGHKSFLGPARVPYRFPVMPDATLNPLKRTMRVNLGALTHAMVNYAGEPFKLWLTAGRSNFEGARGIGAALLTVPLTAIITAVLWLVLVPITHHPIGLRVFAAAAVILAATSVVEFW